MANTVALAGSRGKLSIWGGRLDAVLITAVCQFSRSQFETRTEHDPLSVTLMD
jgi:hypothetical protein